MSKPQILDMIPVADAEDAIGRGVRLVLRRKRKQRALNLFNRDRQFNDAVTAAVYERFREDEPTGGFLKLLQWIIDHQEEIFKIISTLMVLFA